MTVQTRPKCPRCGKRWSEPLEIPSEMLLTTMIAIARNGGLHCDACVEEMNRKWIKEVIPSQIYMQ
jgi:tRNA(Ile2) C34 agmatinyltransferase TiaS